jgi:hypothetical protein
MSGSEIQCNLEGKDMAAFRNEDYRRDVTDYIQQILILVNPYRKEIVSMIRTLSKIGVSFKIIAACLCLQKWKKYTGNGVWTEEDVKKIMEGNGIQTKPAWRNTKSQSSSDLSRVAQKS